jgi:hypothetical protein
MDLSEYSESLRRELVAITRFAGDDVSRAAEMLAESLDSSVRLALLDVLSAAAGEITARLDGAVIDVRLAGLEPEFVVTLHPDLADDAGGPQASGTAGALATPGGGQGGQGEGAEEAGQARITLRMSESLKTRAEAAAAASGMSVNAWLVRAVSQAQDASSESGTGRSRAKPRPTVGQRYTGFARS